MEILATQPSRRDRRTSAGGTFKGNPMLRTLIAAAALVTAWTGAAGDVAGARDQFAALLPLYERVLGPEHPYTLTTRNNLAYWTGQAARSAE